MSFALVQFSSKQSEPCLFTGLQASEWSQWVHFMNEDKVHVNY